ncbi:MAG: peroxidase [Methylococcales bacterium]|nr:peroxidase [Methylococcales bacterium]
MTNSSDFNFDDLQALLRCSHKNLKDTCFLLLNIIDVEAAKQWLNSAPVSNAVLADPPSNTVLQIAFSVDGLRAMGLKKSVIDSFSDEFIFGMSGDESRSRRLGDVGANAPEYWDWGGDATQVPHILLLLYAEKGGIKAWRETVQGKQFLKAFKLLKELPTLDIGDIEPFGFIDGISQPRIDWARQQSTDSHERNRYSNLLATGEIVLGYRNEYGQYTARPLIDPKQDLVAAVLPDAEDQPNQKDFGRNGSYLVLRQLDQDVPGFWQFIDKASGSMAEKREQLAAAMVGRQRNGAPLLPPAGEKIPGIPDDDQRNRFNFDPDPGGNRCPVGAHIRRANPRTGDLPPGITNWFTWLIRFLGFGGKPDEDLVASSRFHRILRRGRGYGPVLSPEEAIKRDAPAAERGLQFICLVANISRQFEFVQNAWVMSTKFDGVQQERDPLLGHRKPLISGEVTDQFNRPDPAGPKHKTCHLPQFVTVRGGGYFFMPGLRALKYLATLPAKGSDISS